MRELKAKFNFGSDFYRAKNNEDNHKYDINDYNPTPKRYKDINSVLVREKDKKGRIIEFNIDIGLSHSNCYATHHLTKDRLYLNKIDNNDCVVQDDYDYSRHKLTDNFKKEDFNERMIRLTKFVDRADFHQSIDEVATYKKHSRYYHFFNRLYTCNKNCK